MSARVLVREDVGDSGLALLREHFDVEFAFDAGGMIRSAMNEGKSSPISIRLAGKNLVQARKIAETIKRMTKSRSKIVYRSLPVDDPKVRQPDISLARRVLKWAPKIPLEKGLPRTIAYFRKAL